MEPTVVAKPLAIAPALCESRLVLAPIRQRTDVQGRAPLTLRIISVLNDPLQTLTNRGPKGELGISLQGPQRKQCHTTPSQPTVMPKDLSVGRFAHSGQATR